LIENLRECKTSQEELEKTNIGPLSVKVANNQFKDQTLQELKAVGNSCLKQQRTLQFCDV